MAKVSTQNIKIYHQNIHKEFKLNLMYNSEIKFYIEIPLEFYDVVHHLSNHVELSIGKFWKTKGSKLFKYCVIADTESFCMHNTKTCLKYLMDKSIIKRNVIIIFYNPKDLCNYNNHIYNNEHEQIGMQFGLTYAVESSIGDKKTYSIYENNGNFKRELNLYNKASTIIDDTAENRVALENLYDALFKLNEKLKSFLLDPENVLSFIKSNIKLLN